MDFSIQSLFGGPAPYVLLLLLAVVLIGGLRAARRRNRREARAAQGAALAAELGWEHHASEERHVQIDDWSGTEHGIPWRMQVRAPAPGAPRRYQASQTIWSTAALNLPAGFIVLMTIPADQQARAGATYELGSSAGGLGGVLAQRATQFFLNTYLKVTFRVDGKAVFGGALSSVSKWTPPELAATYTAFSSDEDLAREFLGPPMDQLLVKWLEHVAAGARGIAVPPALLLWRDGLVLGFGARASSTEELQRITALGAAICVLHGERRSREAAGTSPASPPA